MALADFIKSLEKDTVYSEPSKSSVRVIPPEKQSLQVWPPETSNDTKIEEPAVKEPKSPVENVSKALPNKKIKLNIKLKQAEPSAQPVSSFTATKPEEKSTAIKESAKQSESSIIETSKKEDLVTEKIESTKPIETAKSIESIKESKAPTVEKPKELTADELFDLTGTEASKKELWIDYYNRAKNSRKKNVIVDRMKIGRFTLTPDNKPLLLPDYDIVGKDPDDVLKDKWF